MIFSDDSPRIAPIHAFEDNLIWCLNRNTVSEVVVVDPGEAGPVIDWLRLHSKVLVGVLITHHHGDHTGGIRDLAEFCLAEQGSKPIVYGPESCLAKGVEHIVGEGSEVIFEGLGLRLQVLFVPGHTPDHLAYKLDARNDWDEAIFCGDTLFAAGCGRLLGGTAEQMFHSLHRLASLPEATRVYCAHEYTLGNLLFAKATFPDSRAISDRLAMVQQLRQKNELTLPSTIGEEHQTNPFFTCRNVQEFSLLRQAKDQFRPI